MTDRDWMQACAAVRDHAASAADHRGDPVGLLGAVQAPAVALVVGILLGAAARRTACLVDGTDELAAALVADRICIRAKAWWRAGSDSPDPGRAAAIDRIDLAPGLPLGLTDDAGRGAEATLALLMLIA
jgi:nicotinate-nucleotide--dimethylbenzimidazole phosphoribosyltransferase